MAADEQPGPVVPPRTPEGPLAPPDPLEAAVWLLALDLAPEPALPDLAADALARGVDSPSLRQLAGLRRDDVWEIDRLWSETVRELGIAVPSTPQARRLLIRAVAADIVAGRTSPLGGAGDIVELSDHGAEGAGSSDVIAWLFYEEQELPDERPAIERRIREAAADLLGRVEPD